MKRSLADILIENSKVTKKVDGELTTPSVDNIHTPDNHTAGKKSRTVDGKRGLGDRKSSKVAQVQPPKKGERRSMKEEGAGKAGPAALENPKANHKNSDEGIAKRNKKYRAKTKDGVREGLGDNPDGKASMPFSKASNKDEGMKTPKVAKGKGASRGARVGTIGGNKKNPANIGKTRKMDKSYIGGVPAPVAKIKEGLEDLANFLGTPISVNANLVENYPDGMNWDAFDRTMGTDADDAAYDNAMDEMRYDVEAFLKKEGADYIADYKQYVNDPRSNNDASWYTEHLEGLVEAAYEIAMAAVQTEGYDFEVDEDTLKPILQQFMQQAGVAKEHIPLAFSNYMAEERVAEDSLDSSGFDNTLSDAKSLMQQHGFNVAGGGMTGGQLMFRNNDGTLATIDVHTWRPDEVIGWVVKGNGKRQEGKDVQQLASYLNQTNSDTKAGGGLFGRFRKKAVGEDVGRKYTQSGMGRTGRQVVLAFLDQKEASNNKLHTDGTQLDILGMGGQRVAWWQDGKIYFRNTSGRADQALQKTIKKMAAPNDIASIDDNRRALGMGEMSSGGAVGTGAIAAGGTGRKSQLFAGDMEEAHGTSSAYLDWSRHIDGAETEDHLYDMSTEFRKDRRLTHDEIEELDAAMYRKVRSLANSVQATTEDNGEVTSREIGGTLYHFGPKDQLVDMQRQHGGRVEFSKNLNTWFYVNDDVTEDDDPCWDSHEMVGMKNKGGRKVPNCVPKKTNESRYGRWSRK